MLGQELTVIAEMADCHPGTLSELALQVRVRDASGNTRIYESALDRIHGDNAEVRFSAGWERGVSVWDWRVVNSRGWTAPSETGEWVEGGSFEVIGALRGDVNRDGSTNITDVMNILDYLFKGITHPRFDPVAADVNTDGQVSLTDGIYLLNWCFRGGPAPLPMP